MSGKRKSKNSEEKVKTKWTEPMDLVLEGEVMKRDVLYDPSLTNNPKIKEAKWNEIT